MSDPILDYLAFIRPNHNWDENERQFLIKCLSVVRLNKKHIWQHAHQPMNAIAYVYQGLIQVHYDDNDGISHILDFADKGHYAVDYWAFIQQQNSNYQFTALEDSILICVHYDDYIQLKQRFIWFNLHHLQVMELIFLHYLDKNRQFLSDDASERYQAFLQKFPNLKNRVSIGQIASFLGIQRQSLTRIRKQLLKNDT